MQSQDQLLRWLCHTPASDINFKGALGNATLETLDAALDHRARAGAKTAFKALRAEIHRRYDEAGGSMEMIPEWDAYQQHLSDEAARAGIVTPSPLPAAPTQSEPKSHDAVAPGTLSTPDQDAEMASQLTAQYHRATGGMREVLVFGAMMLQLEKIVSTCGNDRKRGGGRDNKGKGVKGWLAEHAPEINLSTAYRFKDVTLAISQDFRLPETLASKIDVPKLATSTKEDLEKIDPRLVAKQLELFDYVAGTSQRSWLDRFAPAKDKGGNHHPKCQHCKCDLASKEVALCPECGKDTGYTAPTVQELIDRKVRERLEITLGIFKQLHETHAQRTWMHLNDAELDGAIDHLEGWLDAAKGWRKKTKKEREGELSAALLEEVAK